MDYALEVINISKLYGNKVALNNISFGVNAGSCLGLLGPNGAGKSTAMKIVAGILEPDCGSVRILGSDRKKYDNRLRYEVGYIPQEITLYDKLTASQNLNFFGEIYGLKGAKLKKQIDAVLEQVGLEERRNDVVGTFSGGMKRRINIAVALLHQPKLVIMDEPTVGIDPQSRNHIFNMIKDLTGQGITIVYSTHYMEEVEAICDNIAIIDHGNVLVQGSLDELLDRYSGKAVYLESESLDEVPQFTGVMNAYRKGRGWVLESERPLKTLENISQTMIRKSTSVRSLELLRPSLEQVFLKLTGTSLRD